MAGSEQVGVAQGGQPVHQGRTDHAAVAGDIDDLIPVADHGSVLHQKWSSTGRSSSRPGSRDPGQGG